MILHLCFIVVYYGFCHTFTYLEKSYYIPHFVLLFLHLAYLQVLKISYTFSCMPLKALEKEYEIPTVSSILVNVLIFLGLYFGFIASTFLLFYIQNVNDAILITIVFFVTVVFSLFFYIYGQILYKNQTSPYLFPAGLRKLFVFFKKYFSLKKKHCGFALCLAFFTFLRCVPYLLVLGTILSLKTDHCLSVHFFYFFCTFITGVVYLPYVQNQMYFHHGKHSLRLLGWNATKAFIKLGAEPVVKLIAGVGLVGAGNAIGSHEYSNHLNRTAMTNYQQDIDNNEANKKKFPKTYFAPVPRPTERKINFVGDTLDIFTKNLKSSDKFDGKKK
jgi:hypothetical protein